MSVSNDDVGSVVESLQEELAAAELRARTAELALGDAARELPQVAGSVAHRIQVYRQSYSDQIAALRADAGAMEVLRELVRLKGIKENLEVYETGSAAERIEWARDYNKNKPLAWDRARTLLDAAIAKEIDGHRFTGLRFYLELPATVDGKQYAAPFIHRPGDDDSAAVTFWGKRDLREVLRKALAMLDKHYAAREAKP